MTHEEYMKRIFERRPDVKKAYDRLGPIYKKIRQGYEKLGPKFGVAHQIIVRRVELGMTVKDLAEKSRVNANALYDFERGIRVCSGDTLYKIVDALNLAIVLEPREENYCDDEVLLTAGEEDDE